MKMKWTALVGCMALPLLVGGLAGFLSKDSMATFETLQKPPLSPPGWVFPVVWTMLYLLMGIASYLVLTSDAPQGQVKAALELYGVQLFFNFLWTIWFFNLGWHWFAFFWLLILWLLILGTMVLFFRITKLAAYLLLPYLAWVAFAGYLNLGIAICN